MSQVLRINSSISISDDGDITKATANESYTLASGSYFSNVQYVTSSYQAVQVNGMATLKVLALTNTSTASISVALHPASSSVAVIPAGFPYVTYPSGSLVQALYVKATQLSASLKVVGASI